MFLDNNHQLMLRQSESYVCSNDAYDFETGVDKDKKESVVNITGRLVYHQ